MTLLELSCAAAVLLLVVNLLVLFERRGHSDRTLYVVLATIVVDSVINPVGFATPTGFFKLPVGPYSLFLPEIVVTLALVARLAVRRQTARWSTDKLWWAAFFLWLLAAGARGFLAGHASNLILFEAKAVIYVGGTLVLAADGQLRPEGLWRVIRWVAPLAGLLIILDQTGIRVTADLPMVPLRGFGQMGADAGTILGSLGLVGLLLVGPDHRRALDAGAALLLAAAPLVSQQRAALIAWAISIAVAVALRMVRSRRWGRPARLGTVSSLALLLGVVLVLPVSVRLVTEPAWAFPLVGELRRSFVSPGKQQSWQSRQNQWTVAPALVVQHPWIGSGLGTTYWHFELAQDELIETDVTHNIGLDLLMRAGLVGLWLFLAGLWASVRSGLATVWRSADETGAALATAFIAVIAGLLTKGMVESIFEKYRIAVLLGLSLGALAGAAKRTESFQTTARQAALARSNGG